MERHTQQLKTMVVLRGTVLLVLLSVCNEAVSQRVKENERRKENGLVASSQSILLGNIEHERYKRTKIKGENGKRKFKVAEKSGLIQVENCPVGTWLPRNCQPCPVGFYSDKQGLWQGCRPCKDGETTLPEDGTKCVEKCPAGMTWNRDKNRYCKKAVNKKRPQCQNCIRCKGNTYKPFAGNEPCSACPQYFKAHNDFTGCDIRCPAGYEPKETANNSMGIACSPCMLGYYKPKSGDENERCEQCKDGETTDQTGATSENQCLLRTDSCAGRCGQSLDRAYNCQCNTVCSKYGDCCSDYIAHCSGESSGGSGSSDSCADRCGKSLDRAYNCQCNTVCSKYGDCCIDYSTQCSGGSSGAITDGSSDSCTDRCGKSLDRTKNCQCNTVCSKYGDCCSDYSTLCSTVSSGTITDGSKDSCSDRCGRSLDRAYNCQCNTVCSKYGDCCSDYSSQCSGESSGGTSGGSADSCADRCGKSLDRAYNCQCNTVCSKYGDCCSDYTTQCPGGSSGGISGGISDSCAKRCGKSLDRAYNCQCNTVCSKYGDCCSDYSRQCESSGDSSGGSSDSCANRCGKSLDRAYNCQCNTVCSKYGDCCSDYSEQCSGESFGDTSGGSSDSCADRCGKSLDRAYDCQCNTVCSKYGDCCSDYSEQCSGESSGGTSGGSSFSCADRCGKSLDRAYNCQCNTVCSKYGDCCRDFSSQCSGESSGGTSGGSADSCADRCGKSLDRAYNCQCNTVCSKYGDCCSDYSEKCSGEGSAVSSADSCNGRCGQSADFRFNCQCNAVCEVYRDCCTDYYSTCQDSCVGRCGQSLDSAYNCQCNSVCSKYGDCCSDYSTQCSGGSSGGGSSDNGDDLSGVMQDIWDADRNRLSLEEFTINTTPGSRLFGSVDESKLSNGTYATFIALLDNYERTVGRAEDENEKELAEIQTFLDEIFKTEVITVASVYLTANNLLSGLRFRHVLEELWFNLYTRSSSGSVLDSSGFEHVMVGELKGTSSVSGFHSWIQFYREEKAGNLQFSSMVSTSEPRMKGAAFRWHGASKSKGSFFLGTSPEFDLAVYSICALKFPDSRCVFTLEGHQVSIQTWDVAHKSGRQIGSAYPAI